MVPQITSSAATRPVDTRAVAAMAPPAVPREQTRPAAGSPSGASAPAGLPAAGSSAGGPDAVGQAASRAAEELFHGRDVSVESFYDEGTGRAVYRVADRVTGEVLVETPPEELLRFFASAREHQAGGGPVLVALEA